VSGGRERGDPMSDGTDERGRLVGRQRSVDPAVALGELCVVVVRRQHDLEGPRATHYPREVLDSPPPGIWPNAPSNCARIADSRAANRRSHANLRQVDM
jgi:hypothetical protein